MKSHRYESGPVAGWVGYIEPDDGSWIAPVDVDERATFFMHRDVSGAVV